jgi:hypothetical protein
MRIHPKYIQVLGDGIIPLLGFFFWDWNLYFILLFYFIDMFTKEVLLHLKAKKIVAHQIETESPTVQNEKKVWMKWGIISLILLISSIFLIQISMPLIQDQFNAKNEIIRFWSYKEMGIEQGYIFVPLIVFMGYTQFKIEFLAPAVFTRMNNSQLWQPHLKAMLILVAFTALTFGLVHFIKIPEVIFVISIVLISSLYQILHLKK